MASGKVNLAQKIGTKYIDFGIHLMEEDNANWTKAIVREHQSSAEDINTEVFRLWLKGAEGLKPVSWTTLSCVLHDIGLSELAGNIQQVKLSQP
jgi:hypothetical protein